MHNWSLGIVLHVIDDVVWEQSRFLRSYTAATSDTQIISDAAIVRHFTIAMKNNMNDYANGASCIPLTERARKRLGRVAGALVGEKKKPSNLRADEADALLQALPTALEDSLADFAPDLCKAGFSNPLAEDPTAEIIPAISGMLQVLNTHASVHTFFFNNFNLKTSTLCAAAVVCRFPSGGHRGHRPHTLEGPAGWSVGSAKGGNA